MELLAREPCVAEREGIRPTGLTEVFTNVNRARRFGPILWLFLESPLFAEFSQCLPKRVSNNSDHTESFALEGLIKKISLGIAQSVNAVENSNLGL